MQSGTTLETNHWDELPEEIKHEIFSYLTPTAFKLFDRQNKFDPKIAYKYGEVNKEWQYIFKNNTPWMDLLSWMNVLKSDTDFHKIVTRLRALLGDEVLFKHLQNILKTKPSYTAFIEILTEFEKEICQIIASNLFHDTTNTQISDNIANISVENIIKKAINNKKAVNEENIQAVDNGEGINEENIQAVDNEEGINDPNIQILFSILSTLTRDNSNQAPDINHLTEWEASGIFPSVYYKNCKTILLKLGVKAEHIPRHIPAVIAAGLLSRLDIPIVNTRQNHENRNLLESYALFGFYHGMAFLLASGANPRRPLGFIYGATDTVFQSAAYKECYSLLQQFGGDQVDFEHTIDYLKNDNLNSIKDTLETTQGNDRISVINNYIEKIQYIVQQNPSLQFETCARAIIKEAMKEEYKSLVRILYNAIIEDLKATIKKQDLLIEDLGIIIEDKNLLIEDLEKNQLLPNQMAHLDLNRNTIESSEEPPQKRMRK
ncbi:MAG TPA: F-box protein [Gammaproteobacteria bacterium]|nr:F-box protein [Gammaproteobacteria bacterium]